MNLSNISYSVPPRGRHYQLGLCYISVAFQREVFCEMRKKKHCLWHNQTIKMLRNASTFFCLYSHTFEPNLYIFEGNFLVSHCKNRQFTMPSQHRNVFFAHTHTHTHTKMHTRPLPHFLISPGIQISVGVVCSVVS